MQTQQPFLYLHGILGNPLGHSLSPLLHNWAAAALGLPQVYLAWEKTPEELPAFMDAARSLPIRGLSVTIPHKEAVLGFVDRVTDRVLALGAANTLFWREGQLWAENTDVDGFLAPLAGQSFASALVMGAGGAARAVLAGLRELETDTVFVTNRNQERAEALAGQFGARVAPWAEREGVDADLLVNTTPLGMAGEHEDESPYENFRQGQIAYDLVYNPLETKFLRLARSKGLTGIDGLAMFIAQAAGQHALWSPEGPEFPVREARELLLRALSPRTP